MAVQVLTTQFLSFDGCSGLGGLTGAIHVGCEYAEQVLLPFSQVEDGVAW